MSFKKCIWTAGFLFTLSQLGAQEAGNGFLLSGEVVYQEMVKMIC